MSTMSWKFYGGALAYLGGGGLDLDGARMSLFSDTAMRPISVSPCWPRSATRRAMAAINRRR